MTPQQQFVMPTPPVGDVSAESNIISPEQLRPTPEQPQTPPPSQEKTTFGTYQRDTGEKKGFRFGLQIVTAAIGGLVMFLLGLFFLFLAQVNIRGAQDNPSYTNTVNIYKSAVGYIDELIGYPGIARYQSLSNLNSVNQVSEIVSSSLPYIFKKDIMIRLIDQFKITILSNNKQAQEISQEITKYGFIHPDMMDLMDGSKEKIPIMVSLLHTLETVKFGTAIKLFSMLDTFLQQASQMLGLSRQAVEQVIASYIDNGEAYISNYLSMCYLNPYERLPDCNQINDFENYFRYEQPGTNVNHAYLSQILELVENRLETSSVASIKIDFNRFDPNAKNLAFEVTVSTLAEDEAAFLAKGVLNPHVFILSTLVNLLKQSLFVIGESISVQNINVREQNMTVGNIQIPIKTSSMSFDLPLQNSSQREIFDFLDITKY